MSYLDTLFGLSGRVALVTGASRGLGRAMAEALLRAGARVIAVGGHAENLASTVAALVGEGLAAEGRVCDLAVPSQVTGLIEEVRRDPGHLDILINNAGVSEGHPPLEYPDAAWDRTMQVNLRAAYTLATGLAPLLSATGRGSIVNVTSLNAELGFPGNPAYVASKGALRQLSKALAVDLAPLNIRVNCIGPGYFHTDMNARSWADPERKSARSARTLVGRWGEPEDLAGAVLLLASDASRYITGQDLYVDGGWLAKGL